MRLLQSSAVFACCSWLIPSAIGHALPHHVENLIKKQLPAEPTGVKTITSPNNVTIRYKEPGKEGVCETTPGVNSYSGYVDLDYRTHMFFYFFEARHNPNEAPITLWLNGGPGSDSLIGLFEELGPCNVTHEYITKVNPYSWSEESNLLFLSQPLGVGFSYADEVVGIINETTGFPQNSSDPTGRYADTDPFRYDTTALAAVGTWEILQAFIQALPTLDETVTSRSFNLWTESYGGHYGPGFFNHFYEQNELIKAGEAPGVVLEMHTLGIINGIISSKIQMKYYPEFAYKNTYGIQTVNESTYEFMKFADNLPGNGCEDQMDYCAESDLSTPFGLATCAQAVTICRNFVEGPYEALLDNSPYDIRQNASATDVPPGYWYDWLNTPEAQNALGVDLNYTDSSYQVYSGFDLTGDWAYPTLLQDLQELLNNDVRVALIYGDAVSVSIARARLRDVMTDSEKQDYICNWFGGEAVSLEVDYTHSAEFRSAGYTPFVVDGVEYGESRQYGNFSFTRVYESGHEVPYYQPKASLELFRRVLADLAVSDGSVKVTETYKSNGTATATHTESFTGWFTGRPENNDK
ncbi:putative Carboxypeptidase [Seiridium unicorne]|uniref:Carboxypeptidase n=1 Tax=Seiridium unicorne TaxID=138068 RepID=A0ABR2UWX7_9PEZI